MWTRERTEHVADNYPIIRHYSLPCLHSCLPCFVLSAETALRAPAGELSCRARVKTAVHNYHVPQTTRSAQPAAGTGTGHNAAFSGLMRTVLWVFKQLIRGGLLDVVAEALNSNKLPQKVSTSQLKLSTRTLAAVGRYTGTQPTIQSKNKPPSSIYHLLHLHSYWLLQCPEQSKYISNIYYLFRGPNVSLSRLWTPLTGGVLVRCSAASVLTSLQRTQMKYKSSLFGPVLTAELLAPLLTLN